MHWINVLRVDPDNRLIHGLLTKVLWVSPNQLKALSAGTFIYAGLLLTEGTGLLLRKTWAEYFTTITIAGLISLELRDYKALHRWVMGQFESPGRSGACTVVPNEHRRRHR
jgi:uncharacterized membrane protein (DUF2068 family)